MNKNLKVINSKTELSMAQCSEVFSYLHRKFGLSESIFKDYVRLNPQGEIKVSAPTNRIGNPKLSEAIALHIAIAAMRDRNTERIANLVIANLPPLSTK